MPISQSSAPLPKPITASFASVTYFEVTDAIAGADRDRLFCLVLCVDPLFNLAEGWKFHEHIGCRRPVGLRDRAKKIKSRPEAGVAQKCAVNPLHGAHLLFSTRVIKLMLLTADSYFDIR